MKQIEPRPRTLRQSTPSIRELLRGVGILGVLLILCLPLAGCTREGQALESDSVKKDGDSDSDSDSDDKEADLLPVEVVHLERGPIESVLRFSANLEAESEVEVLSQAARLVTELLVEEGHQVRKGQVLIRLQDEEQRSELARIQSQLKKAQREYERQQRLFQQELISQQVMNDATYEVEQLEISLEDARRNLGYAEVRAPISGTVTARYVNLGDHISINQRLFDLVDFNTLVARVYVPEKELKRLDIGQTARLFSDSIGGGVRGGQVIRVAPIVDPKSGTVKVTVGIERSQGLLPGMYLEVELVTDTYAEALLVPKQAVVYDQNQAFLFRLDGEMKAERLRIIVLLEDRDHVMPTAESGLAVGDEIVIAGQAGLKDGIKVRRAGEKPGEEPGEKPAADGDGAQS